MRWDDVRFASHIHNREQQQRAGYQLVEHWIGIVRYHRDYSHVDVHEQAMMSTKTEEKPA